MANPSRYRYIQFYGGRILQAREVASMQRIQEGLNSGGTARVAFDLDAIYREGATFNITATLVSGSVTLSATNSSLPMYIFVRGRWEILQPSEVSNTLSIGSDGGSIFLNWVLRQVTSSEDTALIDTSTGEPTADMGELDLSVSTTDTSGVALSGTQFEKNTSPIVVFLYTSGPTANPLDNVNPVSWGSSSTSGLVSLTTNTSSGKACASDDPRLSASRGPLDGSVVNSSVRTPLPVSAGTYNSDGTLVYNLVSDIGGIDSKKLVHSTGSQLVSDAIEWIKGQLASLNSIFRTHIGVRLGLSTTHPMPTATDVGATPLSHVGMALGLPGSHPASVTANSGGFSLNRDSSVSATANDPAFGLFNSGTLIAALLHNGDLFSALANTITASPVGTTTTGTLGLTTTIAKVLAEHVNQTSHANPHGLTAGDIGAASTGYVDSSSAAALASAESFATSADSTVSTNATNYTNSSSASTLVSAKSYTDGSSAAAISTSEAYANSIVPALTISVVNVSLSSYMYTVQGNQILPGGVLNSGTYLILRFAPNGSTSQNAIEVAVGTGTANNSDYIPVPNSDFDSNNMVASIAPNMVGYEPRTINQIRCQLISNQVNFTVNDNNGTSDGGMVGWTAICWRTNA